MVLLPATESSALRVAHCLIGEGYGLKTKVVKAAPKSPVTSVVSQTSLSNQNPSFIHLFGRKPLHHISTESQSPLRRDKFWFRRMSSVVTLPVAHIFSDRSGAEI
ncbi:unnamed protein product [Ilex paraguariensis]|uniref:Uncharacterized protein n=1 Tax=Ilex paraguariensis TaxID=185542 RepID=A0ABC8TIU0_9AQUA